MKAEGGHKGMKSCTLDCAARNLFPLCVPHPRGLNISSMNSIEMLYNVMSTYMGCVSLGHVPLAR